MQNTKHNVINNGTIEIQAGLELKIETILYENVTQDATALLNLFASIPPTQNSAAIRPVPQSTEVLGVGWTHGGVSAIKP